MLRAPCAGSSPTPLSNPTPSNHRQGLRNLQSAQVLRVWSFVGAIGECEGRQRASGWCVRLNVCRATCTPSHPGRRPSVVRTMDTRHTCTCTEVQAVGSAAIRMDGYGVVIRTSNTTPAVAHRSASTLHDAGSSVVARAFGAEAPLLQGPRVALVGDPRTAPSPQVLSPPPRRCRRRS